MPRNNKNKGGGKPQSKPKQQKQQHKPQHNNQNDNGIVSRIVSKHITEPVSKIYRKIPKKARNAFLAGMPFLLRGAKDLYDKWSGKGGYTLEHNTLMGASEKHASPMMFVGDNGDLNLIHREYAGDLQIVSGGGSYYYPNLLSNTNSPPTLNVAFPTTRFNINPLNSILFPFAAPIAAQYDEWAPEALIFHYKSTTSQAIATTTSVQMGTVDITTQYDAADPIFTSKQEQMQHQYTTPSALYEDNIHPVECSSKNSVTNKGNYYTYGPTSSTVSLDPRLSTMGVLNITVSGVPNANNIIGELWSYYHFKFMNPHATVSIGLGDHFSTTGNSSAAPLGTSVATSTSSSLGSTIDTTGTKLTLPSWLVGAFIVIINWYQPSGTSAVPAVTFSSSGQGLKLFASNTVVATGVSGTTVNSSMTICGFSNPVVGSGLGCTLTFSGATLTASTGADIFVTTLSITN